MSCNISSEDLNNQLLKGLLKKLTDYFQSIGSDFYVIGAEIYFGELTFTSLGGMMNYFTQEALNDMGEKINLSYAKH